MIYQATNRLFYTKPVWAGDNWFIEGETFYIKAGRKMTPESARKHSPKILKANKFDASVTNVFFHTRGLFLGTMCDAFCADLEYHHYLPEPLYFACEQQEPFLDGDLKYCWEIKFPNDLIKQTLLQQNNIISKWLGLKAKKIILKQHPELKGLTELKGDGILLRR